MKQEGERWTPLRGHLFYACTNRCGVYGRVDVYLLIVVVVSLTNLVLGGDIIIAYTELIYSIGPDQTDDTLRNDGRAAHS